MGSGFPCSFSSCCCISTLRLHVDQLQPYPWYRVHWCSSIGNNTRPTCTNRRDSVTMSFLTTFAAPVRDYRLCLCLLNSLRTYPASKLTARTPSYSLAPTCLHWSTTAQSSPAESEGGLPAPADSAALSSSVSGESVKEAVNDVVPKKLEARKWNRWSRRTGLVAIKLGMTQLWSKQGFPIAVTVLQVSPSPLSLSLSPSLSLSQTLPVFSIHQCLMRASCIIHVHVCVHILNWWVWFGVCR